MRKSGALALAVHDRGQLAAPAQASFDDRNRDLERQVYCVLGAPIDAANVATALRKINEASRSRTLTLISTVNLNFLANSLVHPEFRESLLLSDLCTADGMPIVWCARLLGLPIKERVAGADILDHLRAQSSASKLRVFFFGGADGIADQARRCLNAQDGGVTCVGTLNPGYGTVEDISSEAIISAINASDADFLVVALGANKGQAWLRRNHHRLQI